LRVVLILFFSLSLLFSSNLENLLNSLEKSAKSGADYKEYKSLIEKAEDEIYKIEDKDKKRELTKRIFLIEGEFISTIEKKYKNFNAFFEGYCISNSFKEALKELRDANNYIDNKFKSKLFKNYVDWNGFDIGVLAVNVQKIAKELLEQSFKEWSKKRIIHACSQDDYKYINCSNEYKDFLKKYNSSFTFRTHQLSLISSKRMQEMIKSINENVEDKITAFAKVMDDCKCMRHYRRVLSQYYPKKEANLISKLSYKIKKKCKYYCPLLWEVTYTQAGKFNAQKCYGGDDLVVGINGVAKFTDVFLMPSFEIWAKLSSAQESACEKTYYYNKGYGPKLIEFHMVNDSGEHFKSDGLDYDFRYSNDKAKYRYIFIEHNGDFFGDKIQITDELLKKIDKRVPFSVKFECSGGEWRFRPLKD